MGRAEPREENTRERGGLGMGLERDAAYDCAGHVAALPCVASGEYTKCSAGMSGALAEPKRAP